jgi:hypothetical protein
MIAEFMREHEKSWRGETEPERSLGKEETLG